MTSALPRFCGVVLAAGRSQRMGRPKPFLEFAGATFVETLVGRLREAGASRVLVVGNPDHEAQHRALAVQPDRLLFNPAPDAGMLSSLALAFEEAKPHEGYALVALGDMPAIRTATFRAVAEAAMANPERITVAELHGRRAHPFCVPLGLFERVSGWTGAGGVRGLLEAHPELEQRVAVLDPGVKQDADRPADLEAIRRLEPNS